MERSPNGRSATADGARSALAEKLDRLASRLQQIGSGSQADPRTIDEVDGTFSETYQNLHQRRERSSSAPSQFGAHESPRAPAAASVDRQFDAFDHQVYAGPVHSEGPAQGDRLSEILERLDSLDAKMHAAERSNPQPSAGGETLEPSRRDGPLEDTWVEETSSAQMAPTPNAGDYRTFETAAEPRLDPSPETRARQTDRLMPPVPTAEEIGQAVSAIASGRRTYRTAPEPVFAGAGERNKAPSMDRIPRRRVSDWNAETSVGRRIDDKTFNDIRAELNALRANMGPAETSMANPAEQPRPERRLSGSWQPPVNETSQHQEFAGPAMSDHSPALADSLRDHDQWERERLEDAGETAHAPLTRSLDRAPAPVTDSTRTERPVSHNNANDAHRDVESLDRLTKRISQSLDDMDARSIAQLRSDVADIRAAVMDRGTSQTLRALQDGYVEIIDRLDQVRRQVDDPNVARRIEERVEYLSRSLESVPHLQHLTALERKVTMLADRFDQVSNSIEPQRQVVFERQLQDIREAVRQHGAFDLIQRLEDQLHSLTNKVTAVEIAASDARSYAADLYDRDSRGVDQIVDRLSGEISGLRAAIARNDGLAATRDLHERMEKMTHKIDALETARSRDVTRLEATVRDLVTDIPDIRSLERSVEGLDRKLNDLNDKIEKGLAVDLSPIEDRLARVEDTTRFIGEAVTNNTTEARLTQISDVLSEISADVKTGHGDAQTLARIEETMLSIDKAVSRGLNEEQSEQLADIHKTLTQLSGAVGLDTHKEMLDRLERQIGKLGDRVENLGDVDTLARLEGTIRQLSSLLQQGPDFERLGAVEARLQSVADRFDKVVEGSGAPDLTRLHDEIGEIRSLVAQPKGLEEDLKSDIAALAQRLDQLAYEGGNPEQLAKLEERIIALAGQIDGLAPGSSDFGPIEQRLVQIEALLARPDQASADDIRRATRDAVREVAEEMASQQEAEPDPALEELRAQLHTLQASGEASRQETQASLGSLNDKLGQIAKQLDALGNSTALTAPAVATTAMPAAQPTASFAPTSRAFQSAASIPTLEDLDTDGDFDATFDRRTRALIGEDTSLQASQGAGPTDSRAPTSAAETGAPNEDVAKPSALQRAASARTVSASDAGASTPSPKPVSIPQTPDFEAREAPKAASDGSSRSAALKRESVSDLRARLFGAQPETVEETTVEKEENKRGGLLGRLGKKSEPAATTTTDASAPQGSQDKPDPKPKLKVNRRRKSSPEPVQDRESRVLEALEMQGASMGMGSEAATAAGASDNPLSSAEAQEAPAPKQDSTLDLDRGDLPEANTLGDDFAPLRPGSGRPTLSEEASPDASAHLAKARRANASLDELELDERDEIAPADNADTGNSNSLFARVGRAMGRRSGTVAVAAGAALLVAGAMQVRVAMEDGTLASLSEQVAGTVAEEEIVTAATPVATENDGPIDFTITGSTSSEAPVGEPVLPRSAAAMVDTGAPAQFETTEPISSLSETGFSAPIDTTPTGSISPSAPLDAAPDDRLPPTASLGSDLPSAIPYAMPNVELLPTNLGTAELRSQALAGNADAQFQVGYLLLGGEGGPSDLGNAAKWLQRAAAQNHAPAQFQLGLLHKHGKGVPRDPAIALSWFRQSAEQGNVMAMHALAVAYSEGAGGAPDYASAATWFEAAADHGVRDSQYNIALINARGLGVPQDLMASYKWFALAARQGDTDAGDKRDTIATKLDRQQLATARLAVDSWERREPQQAANQVTIPAEWRTAGSAQPSSASQVPNLGAEISPEQAAAAEQANIILVKEAQRLLTAAGYDTGGVDGKIGPLTSLAIRAYQRDNNLEETGRLTSDFLRKLLNNGA